MKHLNDFSEVKLHKVVVIDLYADWCGPCKAFGPIFEQVATEYAPKGYEFMKADADSVTVPEGIVVRSIPTVFLYKDGMLRGSIAGKLTREKLLDLLTQVNA